MATQQNNSDGIVGRGNRDGAKLFREWFTELNECSERGEGAASGC